MEKESKQNIIDSINLKNYDGMIIGIEPKKMIEEINNLFYKPIIYSNNYASSKKSFLWFLVVIICISLFTTFSLIGCKTETAEETTAEETTVEETTVEEENNGKLPLPEGEIEINFWTPVGHTNDTLSKIADMYMAEHPNVKFIISPQEPQKWQAFAATAIASEQEDLDFCYYASNHGQERLADKGLLLELDPYMDTYGFRENGYEEAYLQDLSQNGKTYFVSESFVANVLFYNKDILEEKNITLPDSNKEFIEKTGQEVADLGFDSVMATGSTNGAWRLRQPLLELIVSILPEEDSRILSKWKWLSLEEQRANIGAWQSDSLLEIYEIWEKLVELNIYNEDCTLIDSNTALTKFANGEYPLLNDGSSGS